MEFKKTVTKAHSDAAKILICGAFATGKTTLANALVVHLQRMGVNRGVVSEVARRCPFALNTDQTPLASAWLMGEQIRAEVEALINGGDVLICDRGAPDIMSHTTILPENSTNDVVLRAVLQAGHAWSLTYEKIFLARPDPKLPIEPSPFRIASKDYQRRLDESIRLVLTRLGVAYVELPNEIDDRIQIVMQTTLDLIVAKRRTADDRKYRRR